MPLSGEAKRQYNRSYKRSRRAQFRDQQVANRSDKKILVSFRLEESIVGRVQRMVSEAIATGRYPWRTGATTYRGLIMRGFDSLRNDGDELMEEMAPYIDLMKRLDGIKSKRQEANAIVSTAKNEIHELLAVKALNEAAQWYHTTMESLRKLPADVWSDWAIHQMEGSFPELKGRDVKGVKFGRSASRSTTRGRRG